MTSVLMDEAHLAIDPKTPATLEAIKNFAKRIRKYGGALMVATQNVSDFLNPAIERQGRAVLDNASTKVVFGAEDEDVQGTDVVLVPDSRAIHSMYG